MTPPSHARLAIIATSISAALLMSACQPTADETVADAPEAEVTAASVDPHAGHDMSGGEMVMDGGPMTPMLSDYTDSMTAMHEEMMLGLTYHDPDTAFAQGMLGHHRGAVEMAQIELKYGTDEEMRALAEQIIDAQQSEIALMKDWLASHPDVSEPTPDTEAMQKAYAQGMDTMHKDMMLGIADPKPDMAFARGMLPHHIGAVDMAKVQLQYGKDADMRKLAQEIIDAQQPEIEQMKNWIAAHKG